MKNLFLILTFLLSSFGLFANSSTVNANFLATPFFSNIDNIYTEAGESDCGCAIADTNVELKSVNVDDEAVDFFAIARGRGSCKGKAYNVRRPYTPWKKSIGFTVGGSFKVIKASFNGAVNVRIHTQRQNYYSYTSFSKNGRAMYKVTKTIKQHKRLQHQYPGGWVKTWKTNTTTVSRKTYYTRKKPCR